jgi:hypothetical protein
LPTPPSHPSNHLEAFWGVKVSTKKYNSWENNEKTWLQAKHSESKHKWQ